MSIKNTYTYTTPQKCPFVKLAVFFSHCTFESHTSNGAPTYTKPLIDFVRIDYAHFSIAVLPFITRYHDKSSFYIYIAAYDFHSNANQTVCARLPASLTCSVQSSTRIC